MNALERLLFEVGKYGPVTTDGQYITLPEGTPAELVARVRGRKPALIALLSYLAEVRKLDDLAEKPNAGDVDALERFEKGMCTITDTESALRGYGLTTEEFERILTRGTAWW